jgi:hypothetical protein
MSIVDASTGAIVSHVGSGSSFSVAVSQSSGQTQRYVAEIDNAGGVNIQANSAPVIVTWGGTQLSEAGDAQRALNERNT